MRICLGIVRGRRGRDPLGRPARPSGLPRRTWGYLPEERGLYPRMGVLDQLVYFGSLYGMPADRARREAIAWLARFRIPEYAGRRAEELSKGNQQKVQFIAAVLHDPRGAADGRAVHRARPGQPRRSCARRSSSCATAAGRWSSRPTRWRPPRRCANRSRSSTTGGWSPAARSRDLKRASGRRTIRHRARRRARRRPWLAALPGVDRRPAGARRRRARAAAQRRSARRSSRRSSRRGAPVTRFEVAEPSLEALFIEHVGRPSGGRATRRAAVPGRPRPRAARRRRSPDGASATRCCPNAGIVARREYRDRTRSPLFIGSTIVLALAGA